MKKCRQPGQGAGDHVATEQRALAQKERQIGGFKVLKPRGKRLVEAGFDGQANGGPVEMRVMAFCWIALDDCRLGSMLVESASSWARIRVFC